MSLHPSLRVGSRGKSQRTVLKRMERIKGLMGKDKWSLESKIFGLPKTKILKLKIRKEKAAEKPEEGATGEVEAGKEAAADSTTGAKEKATKEKAK